MFCHANIVLLFKRNLADSMARKIPYVFGAFNYDGLTHAQRVCRLYRVCLQTVWSYEFKDIEIQRRDMVRIRYLFDKNKDVSMISFRVKL